MRFRANFSDGSAVTDYTKPMKGILPNRLDAAMLAAFQAVAVAIVLALTYVRVR
jgi:hypothetical protein